MLTIFLTLAAVASAPPADIIAPTEPVVVAEAKPKKPTKICKSTTMTGSRVGSRVCKTKEQWEQGESGMEIGQKSGRGNLAPADPLGKQNI